MRSTRQRSSLVSHVCQPATWPIVRYAVDSWLTHGRGVAPGCLNAANSRGLATTRVNYLSLSLCLSHCGVISGWHRYCADYIVPACIQWDGPRQLTVRGAKGQPEKLHATRAFSLSLSLSFPSSASLLYLAASPRKRTSFLGTMNCSGRCHCPIARGSCRVSHSKLSQLSSQPSLNHPNHPLAQSSSEPLLVHSR